MKNILLIKELVFAIIALFIVMTVSPSLGISNYFDDTTPPVTTISFDPPEPVGNGWYAVPVTFTLNATDNESGVNTTYYQINNGGWVMYLDTVVLWECGIIIIGFFSVDNAGNTETAKQAEIKIDCYCPVTVCFIDPPVPNGLNNWYVTDVTVTLNATDNESGVYRTYCWWVIYTGPIIVSEEGVIDIEFFSIDYVGNFEGPKSVTVLIDKTKPCMVFSYTVVGGNRLKGWDLLFTATATDLCSGMSRVEFYVNDELKETVIGPGPTYEWVLERYKPSPNVSITAKAYDNAGNYDFDCIHSPSQMINIFPGIFLFNNVPFPKNYDGLIDRFFVRAKFFV